MRKKVEMKGGRKRAVQPKMSHFHLVLQINCPREELSQREEENERATGKEEDFASGLR